MFYLLNVVVVLWFERRKGRLSHDVIKGNMRDEGSTGFVHEVPATTPPEPTTASTCTHHGSNRSDQILFRRQKQDTKYQTLKTLRKSKH